MRDLPALLMGFMLLVYWGRVLSMARRARRKTGRAANLLPPEPVGRALRFVWVPVVVIWVAHPFVTAFAHAFSLALRPLWRVTWLAWAAVALAAACLALSFVCWRRMGKSWRMGIDPAEQTPLVVTGPYAYIRHPIYSLSQALMLASVVVIASPLMIACAVAHVLLLQWEARREEHHLLRVHGAVYGDYCARVGRFIPRSRVPSL